jgi:hypothetical protein
VSVSSSKGAPYFYNNRRGTYTNRLARLAQRAIHLNIGLWKTCPHTTHNPNHALDTGQTLPTSRP